MWAPLGFDVLLCSALLAFGVSVSTRADLANGTIVDTLLLPVVVVPVRGVGGGRLLPRSRCSRVR